jgi:hypothetical protein
VKRIVIPAVAALLGNGCVAPPSPGLQGVWEVDAITRSGTVDRDPEPSQAIFTDSHYSLLWIFPDSSMRGFEQRWTPNDDEMIRRYGEIVVNAGVYELTKDSTMMLSPTVSRVPEFMRGGRLVYDFRLEGDTLWLTSIDEYSFDDVQAPWVESGTGVPLRLRRVGESPRDER